MKRMVKNILRGIGTTIACAALLTASVFAGPLNTNWETSTIEVMGEGVPPLNATSAAQARILARRAAVVDGYRQLAEGIKGVNVDSATTAGMAMIADDTTNTRVQTVIQGARVTSEGISPDGGYYVIMNVPMYGVNSLAAAVLPRTSSRESFPMPDTSIPPSQPNVNVNISVNQSSHAPSYGSSAAPAPAGRVLGIYTGLVVDCRGLGLNPVMSPVIRTERGEPIYGYRNLIPERVISNGMASYTHNPASVSRAGNNPLVVRAVALEGHNANPVVSVADANRILLENGATHFLDNCAVVFIR